MEKKNEPKMTHESTSPNKGKHKKIAKTSTSADGKLRQPTLLDVLRKAGVVTSQEIPSENTSKERTSAPGDQHSHVFNESVPVEVSPVAQALESQKFRFRPLLKECFSILTFSKNHDSSCTDHEAEVKEVVRLEKCRPGFQPENVHTHLIKMQKNVNVVVALVNMSRTSDKM
ncbi:hypothetical protein COLO4_06564 [Corchorus olitorius]|uniref:Uncharacterized protein n=1 Tax=Corchorus olitorius TaxID=93759 RepID=A0A1R3KMN4_9ROSI|nr:hypothetical protein COLO4_06564 [Corchorus olitorius]